MDNWKEEFDAIGFGNQARIPGGKYGAKRIELKQFIQQTIDKRDFELLKKINMVILGVSIMQEEVKEDEETVSMLAVIKSELKKIKSTKPGEKHE